MNTAYLQYVYLYVYSQAMRKRFYEDLRQSAKDYHRSHSLGVDRSGLYTDHLFETKRLLSWWHDFSFILNKRRVSVWWIHPRMRYADAIHDEAYVIAGVSPVDDHELFGGDPTWKRVGRSRKKIVWHRAREMSAARQEYFDQLNAVCERLTAEGIAQDVTPSISVEYFRWGTGVSLCVPMEVRTHADGNDTLTSCYRSSCPRADHRRSPSADINTIHASRDPTNSGGR
jgi:hypothetical protein